MGTSLRLVLASSAVDDLTHPRVLLDRRTQVQIVGVRDPREHAGAAIPDARRLPLTRIMSGGGVLDPQRPVVVVCKSGAESELVALMLQVHGFEASSLPGGMEAWRREGLPAVASSDPAGTG